MPRMSNSSTEQDTNRKPTMVTTLTRKESLLESSVKTDRALEDIFHSRQTKSKKASSSTTGSMATAESLTKMVHITWATSRLARGMDLASNTKLMASLLSDKADGLAVNTQAMLPMTL